MRVLNVIHALDSGGGIETFLFNVLRHIRRPGLELDVCFVGPNAGTLSSAAEQLGVKFWGCRWTNNPLRFIGAFRRKLVEHGPYDAVHVHLANMSGPPLTAARREGVPVRVAHYHCLKPGHCNNLPRRLYERVMRRLVLRSATAIVGCSQAALNAFYPRRWNRDPRMRVILNGVPLSDLAGVNERERIRRELGVPLDAPLVGHVGRFVPQKNHAGLIAAARLVLDRRPDAYFVLVGEGELRPRIEAQVRALGLAARVIFTGLRKDVPALLSAMDLFTLPSVSEGLPVAMIEAQVAGLPVVASRIPAAYEAAAPELHGYMRDPGDAAGLAEVLLELLNDPAQRASLATAARRHAQDFSIQNSCDALLSTWKNAKAPVRGAVRWRKARADGALSRPSQWAHSWSKLLWSRMTTARAGPVDSNL